jgi:putative inorganic carbon (hco3(-)) transporter
VALRTESVTGTFLPTIARGVGLGALLVLPVLVWPGLEQPFSVPRLWLIAGTGGLVSVLTLAGGHPVPARLWWLASVWVGSFVWSAVMADLPSLPATLLGVSAPVFALSLARAGLPPSLIVRTQVIGATGVAVVASLQWAGVDPFASLGWSPPVDGLSVRMRVYGTLGNPNFVGGLMAMSVPLAAAVLAQSQTRIAALGVLSSLVALLTALVATGSRGALLGLVAGTLTWAWLRWSPRAVAACCIVVVVVGVAAARSPARPLQTTLDGRVYLWRVVAPHALAQPMTGHGPGAVALRFPQWQRDADAQGLADPRFRGLTDHVHNDALEALVERGVPGALALALPLLSVALLARRRRPPADAVLAGGVAAVVAGLACASVDFPLARPTELVWWWLAVATVHRIDTSAPAAGRAERGR